MDREMNPGERVEVRLNGFEADEWLAATVTGKARKQEVTLDEHPFGREPFTYQADETSIAEWRPLAAQILPARFADTDEPVEVDELPAPPRKTIPAAERELLELAARAIGAVRVEDVEGEQWVNLHFDDRSTMFGWNPLRHSDDTFIMMVRLHLLGGNPRFIDLLAEEQGREGTDQVEAARRAVTRAAAEIGIAILA